MVWNVYREDFNRRAIVKYNIFDHSSFAKDVEKLLKEDISKDEFVKNMRRSLFYYFGSKTEYETVITSWPVHIDKTELDKLNTEYEEYNNKWSHYPYKINVAPEVGKKVSVYDQVMMNWEPFVEYVWNTNIISQI